MNNPVYNNNHNNNNTVFSPRRGRDPSEIAAQREERGAFQYIVRYFCNVKACLGLPRLSGMN